MRQIDRLGRGLACPGLIRGGCTMHPKELPSTDIDDTAFADHVRVLASDDFLGRKPGTPGEDKTVSYLIEHFRNLVFGKDMVIWTKRAVPEIQVAHSELVFVGYGIVAPEYSWNDYASVDVHGKTVVLLANDPGFASKDPTVFRGNAMTGYGRLAYKVEEAARQGAQGVLIVHDGQALGYGWNVIQATWTGAQFALASGAGNPGSTAVEGWIQNDAARALFTAGGLDFTRLAVAAAYPGFKAVPMGVKVDAMIHNAIRPFSSQNVIAVWPGNRGHEYVRSEE